MKWWESCNHDWDVKSKEILPSAVEQMKAANISPDKIFQWSFWKKIHLVMACKNCGRIYETAESNQ